MKHVSSRRRARRCAAAAAVLSLALAATPGRAENEQPPPPAAASTERQLTDQIHELARQLDELRSARDREIEELQLRLHKLEEALRAFDDAKQQQELKSLREEAEQLTTGEVEKERAAAAQRDSFTGRARNLQALNPEISFLGDVSYDWSSSSHIPDRFLVRGVEVAFAAPLDPSTRFKGYLAAHQEPPLYAPGEHEEEAHVGHDHGEEINLTVEEAYMEWVALPGGTRLRVGRFRQQFGTLNRWHPHALPSVDIPFALRDLFGHDGLVGLGIGLDWQLPRLWASSNGLTLEVTNADNPTAFAGSDFDRPSVLLRHTGFFDLGPDAYLELGVTGMVGPNDASGDHHTALASVDFNFNWEPASRAKYRGLEVRGQYIWSRFGAPDGAVRTGSFFTYATWRLGRQFLTGLRYDDAELPTPEVELFDRPFSTGLRERAWSPYLTFWQSEFVRLRIEYQHATRDFQWEYGPRDDNRVFVQTTFAGGPHKHEAY